MIRLSHFRLGEAPVLLLANGLSTSLFFLVLSWLELPVDNLVIAALLIGMALGLRFRVHVIVLTSAIFAAVTVLDRSMHGSPHPGILGLNVLAVNIAHQIGYLFGVTCSTLSISQIGKWLSLARAPSQDARSLGQYDENEPAPISEIPPTVAQSSRFEGKSAGNKLARIGRLRTPISLTPNGDLLDAVESLARSSDADAIMKIIHSSARRLIGSDGVALILAEGDQCHYVEEDAVGPLWKGRKFKMTECISGWSMINRKSVTIPDISIDERIPHHLYAKTFVKSLVMAPVGSDEPIGALGAYWASTYQPTDYEVETVQILARATAAALENANVISALSRSLAQAQLRREEFSNLAENAYLTAQALAHASLPTGWAEMFSSRITSLSQVHETIDERLTRQGEIDIRELIEAEVGVFAASSPKRLSVAGTSLPLARTRAMALGVVVQELAASAIIGDPQSVFEVTWHVDSGHLIFEWREIHEREAHAIASNEKSRSRLLFRLIKYELAGTISQHLEGRQAICRIKIPLQPTRSLPA